MESIQKHGHIVEGWVVYASSTVEQKHCADVGACWDWFQMEYQIELDEKCMRLCQLSS